MATRGESSREDKVESLFPVVLVPGIGNVTIIELIRVWHCFCGAALTSNLV